MWRVRTPLDCIQIDQLKQTVSFLQKNYEVRSVKFTKVIATFFFQFSYTKKTNSTFVATLVTVTYITVHVIYDSTSLFLFQMYFSSSS